MPGISGIFSLAKRENLLNDPLLRPVTYSRWPKIEKNQQVDKDFLDSLIRERESILATLEILADRELTDRLLALSETVDQDVAADRLLTAADVFGK